MKQLIILLLVTISIISCSKGGDGRLAQQEGIRAQEQINTENENRRRINEGAERELDTVKHFMEAVRGEYKGDVEILGSLYDIYVDVTASMPIYYYSRLRTKEEIQFEKEELTLTVRVLIENPSVPNSAVSCIIEDHRPNVNEGFMKIIKEGCNNTLKLFISKNDDLDDINSGRQLSVSNLVGSLSTGVSSKKYQIILKRL
jgi:hypothetical protein